MFTFTRVLMRSNRVSYLQTLLQPTATEKDSGQSAVLGLHIGVAHCVSACVTHTAGTLSLSDRVSRFRNSVVSKVTYLAMATELRDA